MDIEEVATSHRGRLRRRIGVHRRPRDRRKGISKMERKVCTESGYESGMGKGNKCRKQCIVVQIIVSFL